MTNQNALYAIPFTVSRAIHNLPFSAASEGALLSEKEIQLLQIFKAVSKSTVWGTAIHRVLDEGSRADLRQLIADLKSENEIYESSRTGNRHAMETIIGKEGVEILKTL